ncbi:DUF397 domain-containing protein [Streptomyces sp. SA3_actF]|uniref:DUF397 domain-containing protein n=1 Tax=Streptomyces sp. SA3_actF TaxID=682181 RepID=UPI0001FFFC53|nr:DUF397 domain-containing protein [Streptomyces sp. SA3_actF]
MAEWRKSTYSDNGGSCVEAAADWRTSTYSNNGGQCVEVATNTPHTIPSATPKNPQDPTSALTPSAFAAFVASVQRGTFDL